MNNDRLLLIDCDGTIRQPSQPTYHPKAQVINEEVHQILRRYHRQNYTIIGLANQYGVETGVKSLQDAIDEQLYTLELVPELDSIYFCPDLRGQFCWWASRELEDAKPMHLFGGNHLRGRFRKPNPGMILLALEYYYNERRPAHCWYISNTKTDRKMAIAAGVNFVELAQWQSIFGGCHSAF